MSDDAKQASLSQPFTREERLAQMAQHTAELQKKHPEQDLKTGEEWWAPGIHFSFDCQVSRLQGQGQPAYAVTTASQLTLSLHLLSIGNPR